MGRVNVAHLEARAFPRETARPECGKTPLVRDFRKRVRLVHELRQLARSEEFPHRGRRRFRVDQILRHDRVDLDRGHALLDRPLHAEEADAVLVLHQLADRAHPAVAEVVDVVDLAQSVAKLHERADAGHDVLPAERPLGVFRVEIEAHVHLHAADRRQVIALAVEEERVEERKCGFDGGRFTGAHDAIDVHQRRVAVPVLVDRHRVADIGALGHAIRVDGRNLRHTIVDERLEDTTRGGAFLVDFPGEFVTGLGPDLTGFLVDDVLGDIAANDAVERNQKLRHAAVVDQLLDRTGRDFLAGFEDDFAGRRVHEIVGRLRAAHALREELRRPALALDLPEHDRVVIGIHDAFLVEPERVEERRHRQLPLPVDAGIDDVLGVELEVEPGAAIGDHAAGEEELARGMGLAPVMVEEDARGPVHLGDDHPLGPVHDERAVRRHEGHVPHEDVLFLDVLDRARARILVHFEDDQAERHLQRRGIGHVALLTLVDIVFRRFKLVLHELEHSRVVEILDRENGLKYALDTFAIEWLELVARLQKQIVARFLNLDQVGHFRDFADLAIKFPNTLLTGMRLRHVVLTHQFTALVAGRGPTSRRTGDGGDPIPLLFPRRSTRA